MIALPAALLTGLVILQALPARDAAEDWQVVFTADGTSVAVDMRALQRDGETFTVPLRLASTVPSEELDSLIGLHRFDCARQTTTMLRVTVVKPDGSRQDAPPEFELPGPQSYVSYPGLVAVANRLCPRRVEPPSSPSR